MEDILTERFSYASITPYKDYCKLSEKRKLSRTMIDNLDKYDVDDLFSDNVKRDKNALKYYEGKIMELPEKKSKKGKVFFFTTEEEIQERFPLEYSYVSNEKTNTWDTTKDHQIKRHFGRSFSEVITHVVERSIRRHGDKITIKVYSGFKSRGFNCIYFKKSFRVESITINLSTGNFTTCSINKRGKTNNTKLRCNSFMSLQQMLFNADNPFAVKNMIKSNSRVREEFLSSFDNEIFTSKIQEALGISFGIMNYGDSPISFLNDLVKVFVEKKKIKVPNGDYVYWITRLYPTEKYLKKNERKLIASVLDMLGVKSKMSIKLVHSYPNIDIVGFVKLCTYFGSDYTKYIGNLNDLVLSNSNRKTGTNNTMDWLLKSNMKHHPNKTYHLTDNEKENLIKIANSFEYTEGIGIMSERYTQLLDDHFNMIEKIRQFDPDMQMRARTLKDFNDEHRELSKIISAMKKGWTIEYQYDQKTIDQIEKPIECLYDSNTLHFIYPTILKREEDYMEEGSFMHHCVASYSNKDKSMIVSVRTENGQDRVTCEYDIQTGRCIQKRSFCNAQPPEHFVNGLDMLDGVIMKLARFGILNWKDKKKVPVKINGIELPMEILPVNARDIFGVQLPFG